MKEKKLTMPEKDAAAAAADWELARKGTPLSYPQIEKIYSYMSTEHVDKNFLKGLAKEGYLQSSGKK